MHDLCGWTVRVAGSYLANVACSWKEKCNVTTDWRKLRVEMTEIVWFHGLEINDILTLVSGTFGRLSASSTMWRQLELTSPGRAGKYDAELLDNLS